MRLFHALGALIACAAALAPASPAPAADDPRPPENARSAPSKPRRVTLAFINDVHAQLEPHPELFWSGDHDEHVKGVGGLARIATVFQRLRAERPGAVLFIDGGDTVQGSGPAAWTRGRVVVGPMNALRLDLAVPGNWFVAHGVPAWKARAAEFSYPIIAANVRDKPTGELVHKPYIIKEAGGARVGFIGFTDPDVPTRQPPHLSEGLAFDGADVLPRHVSELREAHKVDLVVLVTHIGLPKAIGLADTLQGKGVDIVLSADTHERTYRPIVRGNTWVVEAGSFASFVGVLDIDLDDRGTIAGRSWRLIELRPELFPEDPEVKKVVEAALAPHRQRMGRVIGRTDGWLARYEVLNTTLDATITDALREASGTEIALSNGYRFAPPTAPGPITVADLWNWLPIPLELQRGEATGAQLRQYWERELQNVLAEDPTQLYGGWLARVSGMTVEFQRHAPRGKHLRGLFVSGKPLEDDRRYTLAAGRRPGAPEGSLHRVRNCRHVEPVGMTTHDAIEKYLKGRSPIRPRDGLGVRCVDQPGLQMRSQILDQLEENGPK